MKSTFPSFKWTIALVLAVIPFSAVTSASANPAKSANSAILYAVQVPDVGSTGSSRGGGVRFKPPSIPVGIDGPGGSRLGGASRNGCGAVQTPLTALVPSTEQTSTRGQGSSQTMVGGLTVAQRPTIWFYVPYQRSTNLLAEFVVQDEDENDVYRGQVALPELPGIIGVPLPATTPALAVGKTYHWYFNVYCDQQKSSPPIFVDGVVHRISPDGKLAQQIAAAKPQEQVALYASNGIWFNALTTLGKLRLANPNDPTLAADWSSLLQSIGLENVAREPLVK